MATRSSRKKSLGGGDGSPSENGDSNWLPDGWKVEFKARKSGYNKGKRYKCYVDFHGHKCYSKSQVLAYLDKIHTDNNAFIRIPDEAKRDCMKFMARYQEWGMRISKRREQSSEKVIVRKIIKVLNYHEICVESEMPDNDWPDWLPDDWVYSIFKAGGKKTKCYSTQGAPSFRYRYQVLAYLEKIGRKEAHENTDDANRSTLDLSMEPENEVIGSSPGEPPAKLATRNSKRKSLAMQGAEGVSARESGSSSVKESGAVELPWIIFCCAVGALYYRKIWEEDPKDEKLKEKLEVAEENVHHMRERFPKGVPEDWNYHHETASNIVCRRDGDSGGELISIATALEEKINEKRNRKRNCCYKQSDRELRRFGAMLNSQWESFRKKLRVENLHFSTNEAEFIKTFEAFGPVEEVQFPKDPETGHCEGLAHIEFYKLEHAKAAAQGLNGSQMAGQTIKIESYADYLKALPQGAKAAALE
uniref:uncharacterized protein LOC122606336 isoform X1 n=1 Tax=Erigeron canadensis TaxID=72917 RepID=UPI001CB9586A|nr:uncharacterized protein LOC122606336 isoform X1 [Erigeron canadensis]